MIETVDQSGASAPPAHVSDVPGHVPRGRTPRKLRALGIGVVLAVVLAVVLFAGLRKGSGSGSVTGGAVGVGSVAPGFSIPALTGGGTVDLARLGSDRRRPVVLNFFASWCVPCQQETPLLASTARAGSAHGSTVVFVGVDVADPHASAVAFVRTAGITYPVGVDASLDVAAGRYALNGEPNTFFIDPSGKVVGRVIGPLDAATLRHWLRVLTSPSA